MPPNAKTQRADRRFPTQAADNDTMASNEEAIEVDSDATEPLPSSDDEELWISEEEQPIPEEEPLADERDWPVALPPPHHVAVPPAERHVPPPVPPPAVPPPVVTITTVTDHQGNVLRATRGRPRTTPLRFLAVTSDPFHFGGDELKFVIRGLPAVKKRPGLGQHGNRYNTTAGLEKEFLDVASKLFQNKGVAPNFDRSPLRFGVKSCFPASFLHKLANCNAAGDCNNLLNFVQDSLQHRIFHDDGQILDARAMKIVCEEYGDQGYTMVSIGKAEIEDFLFVD